MTRTRTLAIGCLIAAALAAPATLHAAHTNAGYDYSDGSSRSEGLARWLPWVLITIIGYGAAIGIGGSSIRARYRRLQQELPALKREPPPPVDRLAERLGAHGLTRKLRDGIAEAGYALSASPAGPAIATVDGATLELTADAARRAVKSGDAASMMIRRASDAVYAVALPVRHPRPQVVERYLGASWPDHLAAIQRAAAMPVLALVVLCAPDATEASLLVGFAAADGQPAPAADPEALLDASTARERAANQFRYVMTLSTPTEA